MSITANLGFIARVSTDIGIDESFSWFIHDYEDTHGDSVRELLDLLGIEVEPDGSEILLPPHEAVGGSASEVNVQTRSAWDVLRAFGAGIEIPPPHLDPGYSVTRTQLRLPGRSFYLNSKHS